MLVIPTSEGRLIEVVEGTLRTPPPEPKAPKKKTKTKFKKYRKWIKNRATSKRMKAEHTVTKYAEKVPGFQEWRMRRINAVPAKERGRVLGQVPGYSKRYAMKLWEKARQMAKEDVEAIKKVTDLDEYAQEALQNTLEVMRAPVNQDMKLKAARQVLEWTKAKPASSSNVTVKTAEDWLESLKNE